MTSFDILTFDISLKPPQPVTGLFFLMFGRDPILPLDKLLEPKVRYLGNEDNILSLETLKNIYELAVTNLSHARKRYGNTEPLHAHVKEGDLVLIKNNVRKAFEPRYVGTFRVVTVKGQQVEVRPAEGGRTQMVHISHVRNILPADNVIKQLPDYTHFGRKTKLRADTRFKMELSCRIKYHSENGDGTVYNAIRNNCFNLSS